ncbi:venom protease [Linepithema humile]|uniref:venom protease n=1 Tax=Linepithema humile TaxID=83485 RepID=UPI0006236695|nr:PREDICTED: serine protease persephone-like [Linepithema humile]
MFFNISTVSSLLLILILSSTYGQEIGERCTIDKSRNSGVCKRLQDCQVVFQELLAGKSPSSTCGFIQYEPIVCCPTKNRVTTPPPTPSPSSQPETIQPNPIRPLTVDENRGAVARAQCVENAKAVYALQIPPTPTIYRKPVNVSLCALKTRKLIVGGKKAEPKEFPHMAAIGFDGSDGRILWNCGGTLISAKVVLTAAHCTWSTNWGAATWVRVGDLNLKQNNDDARPQTIRIQEKIRHPEYKRPSQYHDIAILRLENEVVYNAWVRPACLPVDWPDVGSDNMAVATGWGLVDWAEEEGSDNLLKVTLNLVPHTSCNASFFDSGISIELARGVVNEWQICAGEVGKDTCQGDSGGPLAVFNTDHDCTYNVVGITSVGRGCGSIIPGVYTRVYHYIPWIERNAWPEYF